MRRVLCVRRCADRGDGHPLRPRAGAAGIARDFTPALKDGGRGTAGQRRSPHAAGADRRRGRDCAGAARRRRSPDANACCGCSRSISDSIRRACWSAGQSAARALRDAGAARRPLRSPARTRARRSLASKRGAVVDPAARRRQRHDICIEGRPVPRTEADAIAVWYRLVSPEYFAAMGIPHCGRDATSAARSGAGGRRQRRLGDAAVARREPTRQRVRFSDAADAPWFTVVGVVARSPHARRARRQPQRDLSSILAVHRARDERGAEDGRRGPSCWRARSGRRCARSTRSWPFRASTRWPRSSPSRSTSRGSSPCSSSLFAALALGSRRDRHLRRDFLRGRRSARRRSACAWRSAPPAATCSRWSSATG